MAKRSPVPPSKPQAANSSGLLTQPADELKRLRKEARLSREELARASGLSVYAIIGYEQGRFGMKVAALNRLADALAQHLGRDSSVLLPMLAKDHRP